MPKRKFVNNPVRKTQQRQCELNKLDKIKKEVEVDPLFIEILPAKRAQERMIKKISETVPNPAPKPIKYRRTTDLNRFPNFYLTLKDKSEVVDDSPRITLKKPELKIKPFLKVPLKAAPKSFLKSIPTKVSPPSKNLIFLKPQPKKSPVEGGKKASKSYNEDDFENALKMAVDKKSISAAAKHFNIPFEMLQDEFKKGRVLKKTKKLLKVHENTMNEIKLLDWIKTCSMTGK